LGKATPTEISVAVIPGSEDDRNLQALYDANRVGKGKSSAADVVTVTVVYPDGRTLTLTPGRLTDGPAGVGVASAGRLKTATYQFAFENTRGPDRVIRSCLWLWSLGVLFALDAATTLYGLAKFPGAVVEANGLVAQPHARGGPAVEWWPSRSALLAWAYWSERRPGDVP
jgi:hypothetical protein